MSTSIFILVAPISCKSSVIIILQLFQCIPWTFKFIFVIIEFGMAKFSQSKVLKPSNRPHFLNSHQEICPSLIVVTYQIWLKRRIHCRGPLVDQMITASHSKRHQFRMHELLLIGVAAAIILSRSECERDLRVPDHFCPRLHQTFSAQNRVRLLPQTGQLVPER